jgi:hypothetical protein
MTAIINRAIAASTRLQAEKYCATGGIAYRPPSSRDNAANSSQMDTRQTSYSGIQIVFRRREE